MGLDWDRYNRTHFAHVSGVVSETSRVRQVTGVEAVEAMPEFNRWVQRPAVGDRLVPTVDILNQPWHVTLSAPDGTALETAAERVRSMIRLNDDPPGVGRWGRTARSLLPVVTRRLHRWRHEATVHPRRVGAAADRPG
jgi:hypothetical protein